MEKSIFIQSFCVEFVCDVLILALSIHFNCAAVFHQCDQPKSHGLGQKQWKMILFFFHEFLLQ